VLARLSSWLLRFTIIDHHLSYLPHQVAFMAFNPLCWYLQSFYQTPMLTCSCNKSTKFMDIFFSMHHSPSFIPSNIPSGPSGFWSMTLPYYLPMMNHDRGGDRHPNIGRGYGNLPTSFEEATITTMFDYGIWELIKKDDLAMEEAKNHRGRLTLSALWNLLALQLKEKAQERLKACGFIIEFWSHQRHSLSSLKHLAKDLHIKFPPNIPSSSSPAPSPSHSPLVNSSSSPITYSVMAHPPPSHVPIPLMVEKPPSSHPNPSPFGC